MGWYSIISILSDTRIRILLSVIIVAVLLAIILIVVEIFLNEKQKNEKEKRVQTPEERIRIYTNSSKSLEEKLNFLDKMAKLYFLDMYQIPEKTSYSGIIAKLQEKDSAKNEIKLCEEMFQTHYSEKQLTQKHVKQLSKILIEVENHRTDLSQKKTEKIEERIENKSQEKRKIVQPVEKRKIPLEPKQAPKKPNKRELRKKERAKKREERRLEIQKKKEAYRRQVEEEKIIKKEIEKKIQEDVKKKPAKKRKRNSCKK
jgi:hypothetical protein